MHRKKCWEMKIPNNQVVIDKKVNHQPLWWISTYIDRPLALSSHYLDVIFVWSLRKSVSMLNWFQQLILPSVQLCRNFIVCSDSIGPASPCLLRLAIFTNTETILLKMESLYRHFTFYNQIHVELKTVLHHAYFCTPLILSPDARSGYLQKVFSWDILIKAGPADCQSALING